MRYFCPKNTFAQLKHYIHLQRVYLISPPVIFETIYKSFFTTQILCIIQLKHYTFYKSSPSKCKFSDFPPARVKDHQIPHVIFQTKRQFFFKVQIFFQCHRDNSSVLFQLKLYMLLTKVAHQNANFLKFTKFFMSFLEKRVSFSSNFA